MKRINLLLFLCVYFWINFHSTLLAQTDKSPLLINKIEINARLLLVDPMSNWYLITEKNELQKYDQDGKLLYSYSRKNGGQIGSVDINNPLRIVVYYPDFSLIVTLDNTLSLLNEFSINEFNFNRQSLVAPASGNAYWLYDPTRSELQKINSFVSSSQKIANLVQQTGLIVPADYLIERNKLLYFNIPGEGIVVVDEFGAYLHKLPILAPTGFQVENELISYYSGKNLISYNQKTFDQKQSPIPAVEGEVLDARISGNRLYVLGKKAVFLYRLP